MTKFRSAVMWVVLALIVLLIFLSVYGAFIGAERAQDFFNSLPLSVYWVCFTFLLVISFVIFKRLLTVPSLLLIHLGCICVLAGGMWGSEAGHELRRQFFKVDKIRSGRMIIYEGDSENHVVLDKTQQTRELSFSIKLEDFRMNYYEPGTIFIQTGEGLYRKMPAEVGSELFLGDDLGTVTVKAVFENCKISIDSGITKAFEGPGPGSNPAVEVLVKNPDGSESNKYVFERFGSEIHSEDGLHLSYVRMVSDYISDLKVINNGKTVAQKSIEVNHPLHYGGYHFYQSSYDDEEGLYTILSVTSDTGLNLVYSGYLILCAGIFWHFWLRRIFSSIRSK